MILWASFSAPDAENDAIYYIMNNTIMVVVGDVENQFHRNELLSPVVQWCSQNSSTGKCYAVKEISKEGKHHVHILIHINTSIETFRKKLKTKFEFLKRGTYGISPEKGKTFPTSDGVEKLKRYCSKGKDRNTLPEVLVNESFVDDIEKYHSDYWNQQPVQSEQVTTSITCPFPEVKRYRVPTVVERVYVQLLEDERCMYLTNESKKIVLIEVCKHLGMLKKTLDHTIVKRICYGVHNLLSPQDVQDEMMRLIYPELVNYHFNADR